MKMKERADVRTAKMMAPATTGSKAAVDENLSPTLRSNAVNVSASVKLCSAPVNQVNMFCESLAPCKLN